MLFNSYVFVFAFLPIVLAVFYLLGQSGGRRLAVTWLVLASLFFYGWWNPANLGLILASIFFNFSLGLMLNKTERGTTKAKSILAFGVAANLVSIGYYKYANFFVDNANFVLDAGWNFDTIILPLAISFFTFQQIAYLVDAYAGETSEYNFLHYALFVTFFPQLIAGPIVHHKEMLPQFEFGNIYKFASNRLLIGATIFAIGLFKKTVIADGIAVYATPVFFAADSGVELTFVEAWTGALAYTFQLYFDFSGYSDMAIGLARMFGIRLPLNFFSPYKANNIIDFWRRWHMTLSRFLRDYVYIPLGGSRRGPSRRHVNLMITMLLGGLWHGAGWTFVIWGALHGTYLVINHGFNHVRVEVFGRPAEGGAAGRAVARVVTFVAVVVGWVFFRAETFPGALAVLEGMAGMNGFVLPQQVGAALGPIGDGLAAMGWQFTAEAPAHFYGMRSIGYLALLMTIIWYLPNTYEIMQRYRPAMEVYAHSKIPTIAGLRLQWRLTPGWAAVGGACACIAILGMSSVSEFLYFQF